MEWVSRDWITKEYFMAQQNDDIGIVLQKNLS